MDQGDRAPKPESAASIVGRTAAIDAAFASVEDFNDSDDDYNPSAVENDPVETPSHDDGPDSASTASPASKPGDKIVDETPRPVEDREALPKSQDPLEAPKHWSKDRREKFASVLQSLPDGVKADVAGIILDRNKEANVAVTRAQQEAAQYRRTHEGLTSVFTDDHRGQMQASGLDEIGAVKYLIQQHDALNRDPVGFLKAVIAQTGVTADKLFGNAVQPQQPGSQPPLAPPQEEEWKDPAVVALEKQLADLNQWKSTQEQERQRALQEQQRAQQNEQQRFNSWFTEQCNSFENAIDDEGNPKYPHLPAVISDVVRLVQTDPAAKTLLLSKPSEALEKAYQSALYLNPEIRQQIIDAEYQRRMSQVEAANSVKKAQAASTRKGSPGANGQAKPRQNFSREEAINKAFADLGL